MQGSVAVLIPCYNESKTIAKVISDFQNALPQAVIYVYDNNSTDGTDEIARAAGAVVRYERRQGKGNVIRTMFREIDADCYLMIDGDDTYPCENAPEMVKQVLENNVDMVIGDRLSATYFSENKRMFHNSGNVLVRKMVNTFFHGSVKDILTGYRAFSYSFVKSFPIVSCGFEIETEMTIHALDKNMSVFSIPVNYRDRPEGSVSKLNTVSDGAKVIKTVMLLAREYKPFAFFGMLSLILAIIGVIFLIPVFIEYFKTGLVLRFPTLIFGCFIMIAALLIFNNGLVLENACRTARKDFEIHLNVIRMLKKDAGSDLKEACSKKD